MGAAAAPAILCFVFLWVATKMLAIILLLISVQLNIVITSDAEDFNPQDHILSLPTSSSSNVGNEDISVDEGHQHRDERCRCTCPAFYVPNVSQMSGQIYTGLF